MKSKTRKVAGKASLDPLVRTESFKGLCGESGRFAKTSLADMRKAGIEGAKALYRIPSNTKEQAHGTR